MFYVLEQQQKHNQNIGLFFKTNIQVFLLMYNVVPTNNFVQLLIYFYFLIEPDVADYKCAGHLISTKAHKINVISNRSYCSVKYIPKSNSRPKILNILK